MIADIAIIPPKWLPSTASHGSTWKYMGWGIGEYLLRVDDKKEFDAKGSIAESFTVAPDFKSITFKIRKGVQFHGGYGEVTAEDVAFSHNDAISQESLYYRRAGMQKSFKGWEVVDANTVVLNWKDGEFYSYWLESNSNVRSGTAYIVSKKVVDQFGKAKATEMPIGTGPYEVVSWQPSERLVLKAVSPHYRKTPSIAQLEFVEIREPLVMAAAYKAKEVDMAPIINNLLKETLDAVPGSRPQTVGFSQAGCINFAGNYWAQKDAKGNQIFPRPAFDASLPWVGNPYESGNQFNANTPSMEKARKVRLAAALAVDREAIKQKVFGGFGEIYGVQFTGFGRDLPQWKKSWEIPYDPERAKKLLAEAYPGQKVTIPLLVFIDHPRVNPEAGQAVAQYWQAVGFDVKVDASASGAHEPLFLTPGGPKGHNVPFYHCGIIGAGPDKPWDGSAGPGGSTYRGIEPPDQFWPLYLANFSELSYEKRVQNNIQVADFVTEQVMQFTFYYGPNHFAVGPRIAGWKPYEIDAPILTAPESIVLK
ncbi:MAG: ABC transporter substrate-binding protein [Chloroflexi bacterium]|nr:ABC transporter substrate-binding protein [Chloroflexota bacterium]